MFHMKPRYLIQVCSICEKLRPIDGFSTFSEGVRYRFCIGCSQRLESVIKVIRFNHAHQDLVKQQCPACMVKTVGASGFCDECLETVERDYAEVDNSGSSPNGPPKG